MQRVPNWQNTLADYLIVARAAVREGTGPELCGVFAAGAVEAMTGIDLIPEWRGRFAEFAADVAGALDQHFTRRPVAFARRGDLVTYQRNDRTECVGVVVGSKALFVGETESGAPDLVDVARSEWADAWGVGDG
jgi:hypothetical protein